MKKFFCLFCFVFFFLICFRIRDSEEEALAELEEIKASTVTFSSTFGRISSIKSTLYEIIRPENRWPLFISVIMQNIVQLTGQPTVLYYSARVIEKVFQADNNNDNDEQSIPSSLPDHPMPSLLPSGLEDGKNLSSSKVLMASILPSLAKMAVIYTIFFVDRVGRKPLLLSGTAGCVLSLFTLGASLFFQFPGNAYVY